MGIYFILIRQGGKDKGIWIIIKIRRGLANEGRIWLKGIGKRVAVGWAKI